MTLYSSRGPLHGRAAEVGMRRRIEEQGELLEQHNLRRSSTDIADVLVSRHLFRVHGSNLDLWIVDIAYGDSLRTGWIAQSDHYSKIMIEKIREQLHSRLGLTTYLRWPDDSL